MAGLRWMCVAACLLTVVETGCKPPQAPSKLDATPGLVDFSHTALGVTRVKTVLLANKGGAPLTIHGATATTATVEVPAFEPFELKAGDTRELEVRFTPAEEGPLEGELKVYSDASNAGSDGVVQLHVSGQGVKSLVEVKTSSIDFGTRVLGESRAGRLVVHNPTPLDSPVSLDFDGADADQFSSSESRARLVLKSKEVRELLVHFEPRRLGAARAIARVTVCLGCEPVDVPLAGNGIDNWLEVTPSRVDFGRVVRGEVAEARVTLRNQSPDSLMYGGVKLLDNESGAFWLASTPTIPSGTLAPGEQVEVRVGFSATTSGPVKEARLEIDARPPGTMKPALRLPLAGEGGASCLVSQPQSLDFGIVAEGMSVTRNIRFINQCQTSVLLSNLTLMARGGGDFRLEQAPASLSIPAGHTTSVPVTFQPRGTGASEAGLVLEVHNGHSTFTEVVRVTGTGQTFAPCHYELEPATVEFGNVPVGSEVMLGVAVRNIGTSECFLTGMQVVEGSDPAFKADNLGSQVLLPGQRARLLVRFKPDSEGEFSGMAEGWVNHPSAGHMLAVLRGRGAPNCFQVQPTTLDFGTTRLSCGRERELMVYNKCPGPTTLVGLSAEGDTTNFKVSHGFQFPQVLAPNSQSLVKVTYAPRSDGEDAAALRFDLGTGSPYTVGLMGRGVSEYEQTDEFIQQSQPRVDVLFVVDNSGSMMDEQQSLGANFSAFLTHASAAEVDYHVAVTTTGLESSLGGWMVCPGGAEGGENGRFFPVDNSSPRIITPTTPGAEAVFARNTNVGVCHWNEQGLEAMYRALSNPLVFDVDDPRTPWPMDGNAGFLREDARLAIIVVTDEEDFSPLPVSAYETFLLGLKGNDRSKVIFSAIAGPEDLSSCPRASSTGSRYIQLAQATGGVVESICTPNWAASLERISERVCGIARSFQLSEIPMDTSRIEVRVGGVEVKTGWRYDPLTRSVIFEKEAAPAIGATVQVTYRVGC